jgi:hypothetical protein
MIKNHSKHASMAAGVLAILALGTRDAAAQSTAPATSSSATPTANTAPSDADVLLNLFQNRGLISVQDVKEAHEALA